MEYDDKNTAVLFKNDKKADNHPDYKGSITLEDGTKKDLAMWIKTSKKGTKFMSGRISKPWKKEETQQQAPQQDAAMDSDVPF